MPENEDRRRFFKALGLRFCTAGQHTTLDAYHYGQGTWCAEHRCPSGRVDPPHMGRCNWQQGHWTTAMWYVPRDGNYYCREHYARILRIAMWKP